MTDSVGIPRADRGTTVSSHGPSSSRELQLVRLVFDFPPDPDERASERRVFSDPVDVVVARTVEEVRPALVAVEHATRRGLDAAGYVAYEAAPAFDAAFRVRGGNQMPLLWFGLFEPGRASWSPAPAVADAPDAPSFGPWRTEVDRTGYDASLAKIREAIGEGRSYQVNYTTRMRAAFRGDSTLLYERLRRAQGPGYHALLELGRYAIASVSPELFFHRHGDRVIARPMKGTRARGRWPAEDELLVRELRSSAKDCAENRMIVDLLRNDLGRIASIGSVRVPGHLEVERYRTVLQMTSTVTARVPRAMGLTELFGALFPCGSVTGAPKISTMELIAGLEPSPREVYCGAIGFIEGGTSRATFNVPIRTLWLDRREGIATYGAGGGITWDSTPDGEYSELQAKTTILTRTWPDFDLLETMRLEGGRIQRRTRHLERLSGACRYFGWSYPANRVEQVLDAVVDGSGRDPQRVRLRLSEDGDVRIEVAELDADLRMSPSRSQGEDRPGAAPHPPGVALASRPIDARDPFLYHKTTHRSMYEVRTAEHPGAFDVVLFNAEGEATEMTRGNLVAEMDGRLLTPPRSAGLLAGCFRAELLDRGEVEEGSIPISTLHRASRIWMVNSVRGWTEVRFTDGSADPDGPMEPSTVARAWAHA